VAHVFQNTQNLVTSRSCFAENGYEMYGDLYARAQPLLCSLNLFVWWRSRCRRAWFAYAWFSLAMQAQPQAQTQAIGKAQVKTKLDAITATSKIIRTFQTV